MSCKHYSKENRINTIVIDEDNFKAKKIIRETLYDKRVNATKRHSSAKCIYEPTTGLQGTRSQSDRTENHQRTVTLETSTIFFNKLIEQGGESVWIQED